jgi:phospholipase C
MGMITIASNHFNNVFLRMDGTGITQIGPGGGTVNCHYGAQPYERFELIGQWDGTFAIASIKFPGVYLRMDGGNCQVNCQFGVASYEKFYVVPQGDGIVAFASQAFPGKYLRMDGTGVTQSSPTGGTVNCQGFASDYEKFRINLI